VVRLYDALDTLISKRPSRGASAAPQAGPGLVARVRGWANKVAQERGATEWVERIEGAAELVAGQLMERILGQPVWLQQLTEFLPQSCMVIIGFEGDGPLVAVEASYAMERMGRRGLDLGSGPGEHWLEHRYSVSYKQSAVYAAGAFVDTMEVSAPWSSLLAVYEAVREAVSPHAVVLAHFSHVYPEGSSIYFTFTGFGATLEETLERYETIWREGLSAVARAGGSIAHHHGIGQSKAAWTGHDHVGGEALFAGLKASFDPHGIMNPGKVWPMSGGER
jgi:alkyldihydroxyacetonephosphate synthase